MNEKNILLLKARLVQLGFEPSVETMLRCNICFQPSSFDLPLTKQVGRDHFQFSVHLEKPDKDGYALQYYQATLRKEVLVPAELETLSQAMQRVDWNALVNGKFMPGQIDGTTVQAAFDVLGSLQSFGAAADLLKYKYWMGTPLEFMIPQLAVLKNDWEISERFYFFDESLVITFDDAVRFLSSRWMEKQVAARRKLLVKKVVSAAGGGGGSVSGGRLLSKSPRKLTRRGNEKTS
jgi:hypothetical protein